MLDDDDLALALASLDTRWIVVCVNTGQQWTWTDREGHAQDSFEDEGEALLKAAYLNKTTAQTWAVSARREEQTR